MPGCIDELLTQALSIEEQFSPKNAALGSTRNALAVTRSVLRLTFVHDLTFSEWPYRCSIEGAMTKTIAGFFRTQNEGETAYNKLLTNGFTRNEVSFVAGDTREQDLPKIGPLETTGAESEMPRDIALGSAIGLAAGLVALVIPGIGPLIAIGPLAAAFGGLTAGAGVGGIVGLLRDHGVSEEEAEFYEEGVRRGGSLVTVYGVSQEREDQARKLLKESGSIETENLGAGSRETFTA